MKNSLLAIGECMVELSLSNSHSLQHSFAGDTYNSLVYAKRWQPEIDCFFLSGIGQDMFSSMMTEHWKAHGIEGQFVLCSPDHNVGIYAIKNDPSGERQFDYWRKDSAATQLMYLIEQSDSEPTWPHFDLVYFSGISLGILAEDDKSRFIDLIKRLRSNGSKIAFDPNYRPKMWSTKDHAIQWLEAAYSVSDIVLPGFDDHYDLFGHTSVEEIVGYCSQLHVSELIIKAGKQGVFAFENDRAVCHVPFTPAKVQRDTTAAGDSFAGVYLACRMASKDVQTAIEQATGAAGLVVQHQGAIVEHSIFDVFRQQFTQAF
ncbi:2-dehydro-3-deoxygluconokinase [Paraglaciecola mesophila]|uniref:2-dehydro-3-deoxygluconokinase n=1 Tax=Paraglaciecola mesophila TaxID=197222 RepID=A0A857JHK2_9ALTE|nr:sugar kinase [Paraglaciecola mesophila]QHJ10431.1 2-dehydro-3-deoxygluconokinase [Paraglaciecola mesophila]